MRTWMRVCVATMALAIATPAIAGTITGKVVDSTGGVLAGVDLVLRDVATGSETTGASAPDGTFRFATPSSGTFLLIARLKGFSEAARTLVLSKPDEAVDVLLELEIGTFTSEVSVTALRSERENRRVPLRTDTLTGAAVAAMNPLSTGVALTTLPNITPVGGGPFGVRPRLRGLDSTRLLVLVDGERLNTARQATERTGAEVGLVGVDSISRIEVVNGAGTLMYGSDALSGTVNIITNEPRFSDRRQFLYGLNTFYSTNETGGRATFSAGVTAPKYAVRVQAGSESFDNYHAGAFGAEDTNQFFTSGQLHRGDTIDDAFGFHFGAFPDPFNAPFVRTGAEIPNSTARGYFVNGSAVLRLGDRQTLRLRYNQRRMTDVGFPDFAEPFFFNATDLPESLLDRYSANYEARDVSRFLANVSVTAYYQRTERLLRNNLPVQFPAPSPVTFFPISVMRLDVLSETEQRVWTPGLNVQAVWLPAPNHVLTTGLMAYADSSSDRRTATTTTSLVGQVAMGAFGPTAVVFPTPLVLGAPVVSHPARVPTARLTNIGVFAQDEWQLRSNLALIAGIRGDFYRVRTEATAGYSVDPIVAGAVPPIDPATLPDPAGAEYTRSAMTADVGLVINPAGRFNPFIRVGRSYRHPNLEEMLFAGPATIGSIAPNVLVKPEVGVNFDAGAKFQAGRLRGGAYAFVNHYRDFIAQDLVVANTPQGPLAQATNYARVRIMGIETAVDYPITTSWGIVGLSGAAAFTRGTILEGEAPLTGVSFDNTPADNITPLKAVGGVRFTRTGGRWWAEYGIRAQSEVTRVATSVLESPFLIAQDLLSLSGIVVQRLGAGINVLPKSDRLTVTLAVENLANVYYREQFQFAPARGRTLTVSLALGKF